MAHCTEAYTSRKAHPLIDLYALEGIRLVGRYLPRAVHDGADREARAGLALASLYGGFCLGPVNTTAGHAVAYPLGTRHHIPHGVSCALIFPHTLAFNAPAVREKTARVLEALDVPPASERAAIRDAALGFCAGLGDRHGADNPRMVCRRLTCRRWRRTRTRSAGCSTTIRVTSAGTTSSALYRDAF